MMKISFLTKKMRLIHRAAFHKELENETTKLARAVAQGASMTITLLQVTIYQAMRSDVSHAEMGGR
jgi:hypothetical protein